MNWEWSDPKATATDAVDRFVKIQYPERTWEWVKGADGAFRLVDGVTVYNVRFVPKTNKTSAVWRISVAY